MKVRSKRRWLWLGALAAVLAWGLQQAAQAAPGTPAPAATERTRFLERAWQASGGTLTGYELHLWQPLSSGAAPEAAMATVINTVRQEFQLSDAKISQATAGSERVMELTGRWSDGTQVTAVVSTWDGSAQTPGTVLVIRAEHAGNSTDGLAAHLGSLYQVSRDLSGADASEISACLQGFLDARIVGVAADHVISSVFQAVGATRVEGVSTATETSVSGYSSNEPEYIMTHGRRMNIQVAVHPDTYHHRTNLLIGTPIITSAY
ncbi:MAG: YwmB family TATA-box binding protein [Thermoflavifilum sp.]|nr:YwmB family TATA-box binding protein [Thermoflavifilum sp.]MCL6513209.1 YwmB family TATA-box binding protein [Alicyclobacillus sp.]